MLDKPLDTIEYADLDQLLQDKRPEGKEVEYKRDMYGRSDSDKKELLKDVSSFANTSGGHLLIGVEEDGGIPVGTPGVSLPDIDEAKLWLEQVIRANIEPRIDFAIHSVQTLAGSTVVVIRVEESWVIPHRVVFKKFGEFWARNSAGTFSMDTTDLRRAFNLSETIFEKIKAFRRERVELVVADETPVPLGPGGRMVLHLIPVESFRSRLQLDLSNRHGLTTQFHPLRSKGWSPRYNLDGFLNHGGFPSESYSRDYTQVFRNGVVEAVTSDLVTTGGDEVTSFVALSWCETTIVDGVKQFLTAFKANGIQPPLWAFLTLVGVKGALPGVSGMHAEIAPPIDRNVLSLPELVIDRLDVDVPVVLQPMFDFMWNACGYERSFHYDHDGNWRPS